MTIDPGWTGVLAAIGMLLIPVGMMAYQRIPLIRQALVAVIRMTVQLLLVGFYLQWVFEVDRWPG
jgi:putative ABC transport system permease protein